MLMFHAMQRASIEEMFPILPVVLKAYLLFTHSCANVSCSELVRVMTRRAAKRKQLLKKSLFLGGDDALLYELGTEQVSRVLHSMLPVHLYAKKDESIPKHIIALFHERGVAVPLLYCIQYLQLVFRS